MLAKQIRRKILETGLRTLVHFGGCFSLIEILLTYYWPVISKAETFKQFISKNVLILSKGHCGLSVYATLNILGEISNSDFESYCVDGGRFIGHIKRDDSLGIGWSTGSLGHGLSVAMGIADATDKQVTCILGDGEMNEGQIWEAFLHLGMSRSKNLRVIVDNNKLMSLDYTKNIRAIEPLQAKLDAFGVAGIVHIENTVKGKGVSFMEDKFYWHNRKLTKEQYEAALCELG